MSRSYKHSPVCSDGSSPGTKKSKRFANKAVRNTNNIPCGGSFKKVFSSWEIHDYISRWSWAEAKENWEKNERNYQDRFPTLAEFYKFWRKYYRNK